MNDDHERHYLLSITLCCVFLSPITWISHTIGHMIWQGPWGTSLRPGALAGWGDHHCCPYFPLSGAAASPICLGPHKQSPLGCGKAQKPQLQGNKDHSKPQHTSPLRMGSSLTTVTAQVAITQPNYYAWKRHLHFINVLTLLGAVHGSSSVQVQLQV